MGTLRRVPLFFKLVLALWCVMGLVLDFVAGFGVVWFWVWRFASGFLGYEFGILICFVGCIRVGGLAQCLAF